MLSCSSLRQTFHTHRGSVHQAAELVTALLKVARVTAGLAESNSSLPPGFLTHVTCRLTAKNRYQLRNPTLGVRVWATFLHFVCMRACVVFVLSLNAFANICHLLISFTDFCIFRLSLFIFRCLLPSIVQLNRLKNRCP